MELEALSDQEFLIEELLKDDRLKWHVTRLMMGALGDLNIRKEPDYQWRTAEATPVAELARAITRIP